MRCTTALRAPVLGTKRRAGTAPDCARLDNARAMAFHRFLAGVVVIAGVAGILVLAAMADAAGNPQLGFGMIAGLVILISALTAAAWFLRSRSRRSSGQYGRAGAQGVRAPGRTLRAEESESYPCDAQSVWSLIRSAESAVLLGNAARAFRVPGTPTGSGNDRALFGRTGQPLRLRLSRRKHLTGPRR